jgi:hypothetical protein
MELMDNIRNIAQQAEKQLDFIETEEATKNSLILPFVQALGYNVFDITEVAPEYVADFGTKKGEKIDYAILQDGRPILLIEVKSAKTKLGNEHASQLFRYYSTSEARFGILTNGLEYRFFADLDKVNQMDEKPFLIMNILRIEDSAIAEVMKFTKAKFNPEHILSTASELKYTREIRLILETDFRNPSEDFVKYFARQLYGGSLTQSVVVEYRDIVRKAFREFLNTRIASRLQTVIESEKATDASEPGVAHLAPSYTGDGKRIPVFAIYRGHSMSAILLLNEGYPRGSKILYDDEVLSVSNAAMRVIRTVNPELKSWNGWTWWMLRDPIENRDRLIDDLRKDNSLVQRLANRDE